jgi:hypothetical protein
MAIRHALLHTALLLIREILGISQVSQPSFLEVGLPDFTAVKEQV